MKAWHRILLASPLGILILAFAISIATIIGDSILTADGRAAWAELIVDRSIWGVVWRTVWSSALVTLLCAVLGMPLALFLARSPRRNMWLVLVISPWLVSLVVRTFGWLVLLGSRGILNTWLQALGLTDAPIQILYTPWAVIIGLTHVLLPFMIVAVLAGLLDQDPKMEEAARMLGSSRWQAFSRVTLPLMMPGVLNGASLVLLIAMGTIVTPLLLGGLRDRMLGTQIYTEIFQVFDFQRATAMAVTLLVAALVLVWPIRVFENRLRRRQEG